MWCCFLLVCGAAFSSVLLCVSTSSLSVLPASSLSLVGGAVLPFSFCCGSVFCTFGMVKVIFFMEFSELFLMKFVDHER